MKNLTLLLAALTLLATPILKAEEGLTDSQGAAPASQEPPLLLAAASMSDQPAVHNPVQHLPGMSPVPALVPALPVPVITDLSNAPNPFDSRKAGLEGQTQISYRLAQDAKVSVEIFDLLGNKVRSWTLAAGMKGGRQGVNTLLWDGSNASGQKVSKGGYIAEIVIETPQTTVTAIRKIGVIH